MPRIHAILLLRIEADDSKKAVGLDEVACRINKPGHGSKKVHLPKGWVAKPESLIPVERPQVPGQGSQASETRVLPN